MSPSIKKCVFVCTNASIGLAQPKLDSFDWERYGARVRSTPCFAMILGFTSELVGAIISTLSEGTS